MKRDALAGVSFFIYKESPKRKSKRRAQQKQEHDGVDERDDEHTPAEEQSAFEREVKGELHFFGPSQKFFWTFFKKSFKIFFAGHVYDDAIQKMTATRCAICCVL